MTIFIEQAVADTPSWMLRDAVLAHPDVLAPTTDPALRQHWISEAETERDQTIRLWTLEDRPTGDGPVLWRAKRQTTPAAAWAWFHGFHMPAGHRLVLLDTTKGNKP